MSVMNCYAIDVGRRWRIKKIFHFFVKLFDKCLHKSNKSIIFVVSK